MTLYESLGRYIFPVLVSDDTVLSISLMTLRDKFSRLRLGATVRTDDRDCSGVVRSRDDQGFGDEQLKVVWFCNVNVSGACGDIRC